jgi:hypothetical protein
MKVKELIEKLQAVDGELEVFTMNYESWYYELINSCTVQTVESGDRFSDSSNPASCKRVRSRFAELCI